MLKVILVKGIKLPQLFIALLITIVILTPTVAGQSLPVLLEIKPGIYHSDIRPGTSVKGYWSWSDYPYSVPNELPLKIVVMKDIPFSNFKGPISIDFKTPHGSFSRILMRVDVWMTSIVPGRPAVNYDRPLWTWIDGVPAYMGTTVERFNQTGFVDVTHLYSLLVGGKNATVSVALPNWVIPKWGLTGVFHVKVTFLYYPGPKPSVPDKIIPLFPIKSNPKWLGLSRVVLTSKKPNITQEINLPPNTVKVYLLLYTEGHSAEEFWYTNTPPDRYFIFEADGKPVAIVQPYPYIFTGGINLFLWRPIPSIRALSFVPHIIDLTPALPLLIGRHNLTLTLHNAMNYWSVFAALLIYTDENAIQVTGNIVKYNYIPPKEKTNVSTENGAIIYKIESSASLEIESKINVYTLFSSYSYEVYGKQVNIFNGLISYNDVWFNISLDQNWIYSSKVVNVEPSWIKNKVTYSWSDEWNSSLKLYDMFNITSASGDISKASSQNPVYANFSEKDWITQELNITRDPWPFTSTYRDLKIHLNGYAFMDGTLMFISPYAALITGLSAVGGNTSKTLQGKEIGNGYLFEFSRMVSGGNEWPHWWISKNEVELVIQKI